MPCAIGRQEGDLELCNNPYGIKIQLNASAGALAELEYLPWSRFPGSDVRLGPEMTGEVMGVGASFPVAYAKTREAIDYEMPSEGTVFISVRDSDKRAIAPVAFSLKQMGYRILATCGTAKTLRAAGIDCEVTKRVGEGRPNVRDVLSEGGVSFIINTPHGHGSHGDGALLRSEAVNRGITNVTTLSGATALLQSLAVLRGGRLSVNALQDLLRFGNEGVF